MLSYLILKKINNFLENLSLWTEKKKKQQQQQKNKNKKTNNESLTINKQGHLVKASVRDNQSRWKS